MSSYNYQTEKARAHFSHNSQDVLYMKAQQQIYNKGALHSFEEEIQMNY